MSQTRSEEERITKEAADWGGRNLSRSSFFDHPELQQPLETMLRDALAEFAAGAGHEINNPLAIIGGHAQMLLDEIENPSQKRRLAVILAQVRRAYEMIADIRLFARPPKPEFVDWNPAQWLDSFCTAWVEANPETADHLHWLFTASGEIPVLQTDPAILGTAVGALLKNAEQALAGNANRQIDIIGRFDSDGVTIRISDNGPGIPESIRNQIFLPYFSGRSSGRGLGFGLPKAQSLISRLGGRLTLESGPETVFCLFLPFTVQAE